MGLAKFFESLGANAQSFGKDLMDYEMKKKILELQSQPKPRDPLKDALMQSQIAMNMARLSGKLGRGGRGGGGRGDRSSTSTGLAPGMIDIFGYQVDPKKAYKGIDQGNAAADREFRTKNIQSIASLTQEIPMGDYLTPEMKKTLSPLLTDILRNKVLIGDSKSDDLDFLGSGSVGTQYGNWNTSDTTPWLQNIKPGSTPSSVIPTQQTVEPEFEFDPTTGKMIRIK